MPRRDAQPAVSSGLLNRGGRKRERCSAAADPFSVQRFPMGSFQPASRRSQRQARKPPHDSLEACPTTCDIFLPAEDATILIDPGTSFKAHPACAARQPATTTAPIRRALAASISRMTARDSCVPTR